MTLPFHRWGPAGPRALICIQRIQYLFFCPSVFHIYILPCYMLVLRLGVGQASLYVSAIQQAGDSHVYDMYIPNIHRNQQFLHRKI